MILESYPWKQDLLRRIALIKKYNSTEFFQKNEERAYTVLEKSIFYSAFIVRKLLDCKSKLSDDADKYSLNVQELAPLKTINFFNSHRIDQNYNWEKTRNATISGRDICNYLIHSYIFQFIYCDNPRLITSFIVASDRIKDRFLYMVQFEEWLKYLNFIALDDIVECKMIYDNKLKDYRFVKKSAVNVDAI